MSLVLAIYRLSGAAEAKGGMWVAAPTPRRVPVVLALLITAFMAAVLTTPASAQPSPAKPLPPEIWGVEIDRASVSLLTDMTAMRLKLAGVNTLFVRRTRMTAGQFSRVRKTAARWRFTLLSSSPERAKTSQAVTTEVSVAVASSPAHALELARTANADIVIVRVAGPLALATLAPSPSDTRIVAFAALRKQRKPATQAWRTAVKAATRMHNLDLAVVPVGPGSAAALRSFAKVFPQAMIQAMHERDTRAPTAPSIHLISATTTSVSVGWQPSLDDTAVAQYGLYRNGRRVGDSLVHWATFEGLTCGTSYVLEVDAADGAGNRSARGRFVTATATCGGSTPPASPSPKPTTPPGKKSPPLPGSPSTPSPVSPPTPPALPVPVSPLTPTPPAPPAPPPPPAEGSAQQYISPAGSDANGCTHAAPCRTFNRAYQLARCGSVVVVAGGTYPADAAIRYNPGLSAATCNKPVLFKAADGAQPVIGRGVWEWGQCRTYGPPHNLTLDGVDIAGEIKIDYCSSSRIRGTNLTIQNARFTGNGQKLGSGSVKNFTLRNVEFGPICCNSDAVQIAQGQGYPESPYPDGVTLDNVYWHDVRNNCSDIPNVVWPNCTSESDPYRGNHVDCLQTTGIANLTIKNSRFINCQTGVQAHREKGRNYDWLIINNIFSGFHPFNFGSHGAYYAFEGKNLETGAPSFLKFYFNTFAAGLSIGEVDPAAHVELVGNIIAGLPNTTACNIRHDYGLPAAEFAVKQFNMASKNGTACGPTNLTSWPRFVNPSDAGSGPPDYRLAPGSEGIDDGPASCAAYTSADYESDARPRGSACDVGADER